MKTQDAVAQLPFCNALANGDHSSRNFMPKNLRCGYEPVLNFFDQSVPQIPHAATRINTSPAPITGTGTVSTTTLPLPRYTAARIVDGAASAAVCEVSRIIPD